MHTINSNLSESLKKAATAGLMALIVAGTTAASSAQQATAAAKPAALKSAALTAKPVAADDEEEAPAKPNKSGSEGIHVNGHWIMDVKDKDGRVVDHRDFHNALAEPTALIGLLSGMFSASSLQISLVGTGSNLYQIAPAGSIAAAICPIQISAHPGLSCNPNLTQTLVVINGGQYSGLTLQGQIVPTTGDTIRTVATFIYYCGQGNQNGPPSASTVSPATCATATNIPFLGGNPVVQYSSDYEFTAKDISAAPIVIAAGQTLSVTVTLSFN